MVRYTHTYNKGWVFFMSLYTNKETKYKDIKEVLLYTSTDDFNIGMVENLLKNNNIPSIKRYRGAGSYTNIYMGLSSVSGGIDLYIDREDYKKALELLESTGIQTGEINNELDPEDIEADNNFKKKVQSRALWLLVYLLIIMLAIYILSISLSS